MEERVDALKETLQKVLPRETGIISTDLNETLYPQCLVINSFLGRDGRHLFFWQQTDYKCFSGTKGKQPCTSHNEKNLTKLLQQRPFLQWFKLLKNELLDAVFSSICKYFKTRLQGL